MAEHVAKASSNGGKRKHFSAAELYNPAMVTIIVSNAAIVETGEEPIQEEFSVQRAVICAHSKYFESAFRRQWIESKSRRVQIDDLHPRFFRIFMGWLFYQEIFYDPNRVDLNALESDTAPSPDEEPVCTRIEEKPVQDKPITWEWMELFGLYIFSEKYDTRALRLQTFNIIQERLLRTACDSTRYKLYSALPSAEEVTYLVDNMPADSGIVKLLASFFRESSPQALCKSSTAHASMPSSFLVYCWNHSLRYLQAQNCAKCQQGKAHDRKVGHRLEDSFPFELHDPCQYHEHGDDSGERKACAKAWETRLEAMLHKTSAGGLERRRAYHQPIVKLEPIDSEIDSEEE